MYQKGNQHASTFQRTGLSRGEDYNCAHELGHHVFGHGSSIDELREESKASVKNPKEFLVDVCGNAL